MLEAFKFFPTGPTAPGPFTEAAPVLLPRKIAVLGSSPCATEKVLEGEVSSHQRPVHHQRLQSVLELIAYTSDQQPEMVIIDLTEPVANWHHVIPTLQFIQPELVLVAVLPHADPKAVHQFQQLKFKGLIFQKDLEFELLEAIHVLGNNGNSYLSSSFDFSSLSVDVLW